MFFLSAKVRFIPPGDKVLKGITREKIIDLCNKLHYNLIEQTIFIGSLNDFDAAFFTGTSPKVLPIRRIANVGYDVSNPVMNALITGYDNMIASYIYHW
jgi:branched-chain amino acid aminotransferase